MNPTLQLEAVRRANLLSRSGHVVQIEGLTVEAEGPDVAIGETCDIQSREQPLPIEAEVVGFRNGRVQLMPYRAPRGVGVGARVCARNTSSRLPLGVHLLGRVVNALGEPLDGRPLAPGPAGGDDPQPVINPLERPPIRTILETGVKAIDATLTVGRGQRVGIFAGSGVGKSTLLGMIANRIKAQVSVIALIGERGREVREFIENSLGEGIGHAVVVVATADESPLMRTRAAVTATRIAEQFRDQGRHAVLIMDSLTRFAMARREIGIAVGEPPTARGYTPSVFTVLPALVERAGTTANGGSLTAFYTILTESDDLDDPIADHVRSILDGAIVLSRELAQQGHFPAIDLPRSNSRLLGVLASAEQRRLASDVVALLSTHDQARDMIDVGAYRAGANPAIDRAIALLPALRAWLAQDVREKVSREEALRQLQAILRSAGNA